MALLMIFGGLLKGGRNQEIDPRIPIIAVMGKTGVGKSTFIKILGGWSVYSKNAPVIGHSLESSQ